MDPSTERDLETGSASAEKEDVSTQQQISQSEHSTNQPTGDSLNAKSLPADTSSTLSVSAEPFKSTSFDQSSTMLSALAKEFVPKAIPTPVYTESYQAYGVEMLCCFVHKSILPTNFIFTGNRVC